MLLTKYDIDKEVMLKAFRLMCTAKTMTEVYEENFKGDIYE